MELSSTKSIIKKTTIIKEHKQDEDFRKMLNYLLNPDVITGISGQKMNKSLQIISNVDFSDFDELMSYLMTNSTGRDVDIANVQKFLSQQTKEAADFFESIITKKAKIGCDIKIVNKAFEEDFISQWEVQQSFSVKNVQLSSNEWFSLSQKLNGVRGTYYNGKLLSRQGKEFFGLEHILVEIQSLPDDFKEFVLDGELIRENTEGVSDNENFRLGNGILNQDGTDKSSIKYVIFDLLPRDEFDKKESRLLYKDRQTQLKCLKDIISSKNMTNISIVEMFYCGTDQRMISFYLGKMVEEGKEGLMLNRNSKYYCKRHNGILKVKKFYTVDLKVIGVEEGTGRLTGMLGAFVVTYKNNSVKVGSGLSDTQRLEFWERRDELIGRVIEVKYKEESFDKVSRKKSLQFPIFISLREMGKEISYS